MNEEIEDHRYILTKMLGIKTEQHPYREAEPATWAEIYEAIGKLKARAEDNQPSHFHYPQYVQDPCGSNEPPHHYHGTHKCYNNPCLWA